MSVFRVPNVFQSCSEHGATNRVPVFLPLRGEHGEHGGLRSELKAHRVPSNKSTGGERKSIFRHHLCHEVPFAIFLSVASPERFLKPFQVTITSYVMTSKAKTSPRNRGGRPRNPRLDAIEKEMAVTRRRASTILKECGSENKGLSPVAEARLRKLNLEASRLESQIRTLKIEAAILDRTLLTSEDAIAIFSPPHLIVREMLSIAPKTLAPRLYGLPQKAIEESLVEWTNSVLGACHAAVVRTCSEIGDGHPIESVL